MYLPLIALDLIVILNTPKKDLNLEKPEVKEETSKEDVLVNSNNQLSLVPDAETVIPAPVKHIPIAHIPTKPSAISVNTKKPRSVYIPTLKNDSSKKTTATDDYDPWSVIDSSEKTYSRYSYEKQDYDSEDELFKPLFDNSNQTVSGANLQKNEDDSKTGYDDETDNSPDGAELSAEDEDVVHKEGEQVDTKNSSNINEGLKPSKEQSQNIKEIKCKKKRKYAEINASKIKEEQNHKNDVDSCANESGSSPKRIKSESESNGSNDKKREKKICKYKDKNNTLLDNKSTEIHDKNSDKYSSDNKKSLDKKTSVNKPKHSSGDHKSNHSDKKRSTSDGKKSSSDKHNRKNEDDKKDSCESKDSSGKIKKSYNSDKQEKKHSSANKNHSSKSKHHSSSRSKSHSSSDRKNDSSSDRKSHSSSDRKSQSSSGSKNHDGKHSSSSNKQHESDKYNSVSETKKLKTSDEKLKEKNNKENLAKNKELLYKNKSSKNKHDKDKKTSGISKQHSSSSKSKYTYEMSDNKDKKRKLHSSRESSNSDKHRNENNFRKHSEDTNSEESDVEKKEPILISDSSNLEDSDDENDKYGDSIVGIDDIEGLSDSDRESDDHKMSELEEEEEYVPQPISNSKTYPVYKPASKEDLEQIKAKFQSTSTSSQEEYKPVPSVSKVRIAHVPNVSSLISAKSLISSGKTVPPALHRIVTSTHIVNPRIPNNNQVSTSTKRPQITTNLDSNIALSIRQPGLNNIFDELIKFVNYDEAFKRAVDEELEICNIATNPQSYRNRIALCILKIRKSKGAVDVVKKEKITSASKPDYTYGLTLYECFSKYLLKPEDYVLHGYPLELPGKSGCVYIDKNSYFRNKHNGPREGPFRKCCNCGQEYAVDEETEMPLTKNDCHHHWGKPIGIARLGKTYTCCKGEMGSEPCHTSLYHVTETKNDDCLEGFVRTLPYPSDADPNKAGIYAMDCEMCYTTKGRDIVRVSLLSIDNESVYDVLIKPKYPILDYCTRFSGITEEKLQNVTTTLPEVQKFVLKMINDKTILVGHSLENDLKALKLIHYNVVDTSLMFPHKEGFPVKCALRTLTSRYLGQAIQTGENGHDSLEDARASLMLVLYQVKEDAKCRKPRVLKQLKSK